MGKLSADRCPRGAAPRNRASRGDAAVNIDRRTFVTSVAAAVAVGPDGNAAARTLQQNHSGPHHRAGAHPKNVVLMLCDDLGYGDLGCYGGALPTPNLDRLAKSGMRFTQFNAAHPLCSASRAALLTGRYAPRSHTAGVYFPHAETGMALDETTVAELFKASGYRTKAIGKWHLGDAPEYLPTTRGFESFFGVPYSVDMQPLPMMRDTAVIEADTDRDLLTPRYTEEAVRYIEEAANVPFFLYLAYSYPHDPARASPRFRDRSGFGWYGDSVQELDWSVGEILAALERKGILDETLVLFTSDHGPWFQGSPGALRGRKGSTFEGGFRVPLIARWPARIAANTVADALTSNLDLLPTLAGLCDLEPPRKPLDGIDISPILCADRSHLERKSLLYFTPFSPFEAAHLAGGAAGAGVDLHCARRDGWKLRFAQLTGEIYVNDYTDGHQSYWLPRPELYDLAADPGECYNVAWQHEDLVRDMLTDILQQVRTFPAGVSSAFAQLRGEVANHATRPGEAPRAPIGVIAPWAWLPRDRR